MKLRLFVVGVCLTASTSAFAAGPHPKPKDVGELANAPIDVRQLVEDLGRLLNAYSSPMVHEGTDMAALSNEDGIITRRAFQDWARSAGSFDDDPILDDSDGVWKNTDLSLFDESVASVDKFVFDLPQTSTSTNTLETNDNIATTVAHPAGSDRNVLATLNVQSFGID